MPRSYINTMLLPSRPYVTPEKSRITAHSQDRMIRLLLVVESTDKRMGDSSIALFKIKITGNCTTNECICLAQCNIKLYWMSLLARMSCRSLDSYAVLSTDHLPNRYSNSFYVSSLSPTNTNGLTDVQLVTIQCPRSVVQTFCCLPKFTIHIRGTNRSHL